MSKWENATQSPTFATNHLHTLKTREQKTQSSDSTPQLQHKPASGKLEKPFLHPLLLQSSFSIPAKGGTGKGIESWYGAGHRGRGGTINMGPADRAEGFVTHTHGGPGAGQAKEPDLSPKPSTEPREAPAPQGGTGQQQLLLILRHRATAKPVKKMTQ